MPKLTQRFVESIVPDSKNVQIFWDDDLKGFGVVVRPSGRQTYWVQYRNRQRALKRLKLGVHGQVTTEEARMLAKQQVGRVSHGDDPLTEKKQLKKMPSFEDLAQDYLTRHACRKRPKSLGEDQKLLNRIAPFWNEKKVAHITRRDVENLHRKFEKTPYQANRTLSLLSKMFELAMLWELCDGNPVKGVMRYAEEKKDRWLDEEELKRLWAVFERTPHHPTAYGFKLLLLTGAGKNEVFKATWDQFDLEAGIWTQNHPSKPSSG